MSEQPKALRLADELDVGDFDALTNYAAADELRRLHQHELAHIKWLEKTEWVQDTVHYSELGQHRADVIKQRFDRLHEVNQELLEALKYAEAGLADIGDADREPGDDLAWCEKRAAEALPTVRAAIAKGEQA